MSNNSKTCACGFETSEFTSILTILNDRIGEARVHDLRLSPEIIKLNQDFIGPASIHLHKMKDFCNIDIKEEDDRLKNIRKKFTQINDPEKRIELTNDVSFVIDNIKRKLYECAREK